MGDKDVWHTIHRKSWWDGSVIFLCGFRAPAGNWVHENWVLPKVGKDCPKCHAIKQQRK